MSVDTLALAGDAVVATETPPGVGADAAGGERAFPWREMWVAVIALAAAAATIALVLRGEHSGGLFLPILCLGAVALAAGFDAATGRIANPITYTAILLGLGMNSLGVPLRQLAPRLADHWLGAAGPTQALVGLLVFGGIGMLCRLVPAGMGGGDMKLLAAVGAMLGLSRAAEALTCALAVAVCYSLINLAIRGRLNATVRAAAVMMLNLVYLRDRSPTVPTALPSRRTVPLAVPIFLGLLLSRLPQVAAGWQWLQGTK